jgi:hypothetical protein
LAAACSAAVFGGLARAVLMRPEGALRTSAGRRLV